MITPAGGELPERRGRELLERRGVQLGNYLNADKVIGEHRDSIDEVRPALTSLAYSCLAQASDHHAHLDVRVGGRLELLLRSQNPRLRGGCLT